jgi:hypothetical protein
MRAQERNDTAATAALLRRAVRLYDADDAELGDALVTLAESLTWTGDPHEAPALLARARAAAERRADRRLLARVTVIEHSNAIWTRGGASADRILRDLDSVIPILEEAGDDRALAEAYHLRFHALDRTEVAARPGEALVHALTHARRAGSAYLESWALSWICITLPFGDVPVPRAMANARAIVEEAPNRAARAAALGALALLHAMRGEFEEARRLEREDVAILADMGLHQAIAAHSIAHAEIEILADDLAAAEAYLRDGFERLRAFRDQHSAANAAWRLALVLARTGRDAEAERFTGIAEETTPHGFWVGVWWKVVRAGVAARAGRAAEADGLLARAFSDVDSVDASGMHVDAWIEAAGALRALGRVEEADALLARAAELARRLGYVVAGRRAEALMTR